jgi:uncharacterized membrane protein YfcA
MLLSHDLVYITHILFVAPLLIYAGYIGHKCCNKTHDKQLFKALGGIGVIVLVYHLYLLVKFKGYLGK